MTENEAKGWLEYIGNMNLPYDRSPKSRKLACDMAIKALEKVQQFESIGTIEEFKDLKEKNEPKKPIIRPWSDARCPSCGCSLSESLGDGYYKHFESLERCDECNQKLDWQ